MNTNHNDIQILFLLKKRAEAESEMIRIDDQCKAILKHGKTLSTGFFVSGAVAGLGLMTQFYPLTITSISITSTLLIISVIEHVRFMRRIKKLDLIMIHIVEIMTLITIYKIEQIENKHGRQT